MDILKILKKMTRKCSQAIVSLVTDEDVDGVLDSNGEKGKKNTSNCTVKMQGGLKAQ